MSGDDNLAPPKLTAHLSPVEKATDIGDEENEPPPVLARDEQTARINKMFETEARLTRDRLNALKSSSSKRETLKHFVDGVIIEEDIEPFPIEKKDLIERLEGAQSDEGSPTKTKSSPKKSVAKATKVAKEEKSSPKKGTAPVKGTTKKVAEKVKPLEKGKKAQSAAEKKSRANKELDGLLNMDFGPGKTPFPVRLV
jgi:hypothetical protein